MPGQPKPEAPARRGRDSRPQRRLAVCRELTKLHEEVFVGTAAEALAYFEAPHGEIVLVIEGSDAPAARNADDAGLADDIAQMKPLGLTRAQAAALLARQQSPSCNDW